MSDGKTKVIEAALHVISELGINGATVRGIAEEAGISTGAIYHYYHSKEDILYDIFDQGLTASNRIAEISLKGEKSRQEITDDIYASMVERFGKSAENRLQFYLAHEAMLGNTELQNKFIEKYNDWISRVEDILLSAYQAQPHRLNRALAAWLIAAVDGIVMQLILNVGAAEGDDILAVFDLLLEEGIPHFLKIMQDRC
ncbi:Tetracycline transcriptional regulator, TetR-related, C-terminal [Syntrophomonas zehnderi OL-4]|uniref:Tetracycline transcriptional regulator, TetR-related, C-terminal n=1 Tax=Syntrophomonas zehnderi OL-4 TaxID=690567 RepID=A0A0E3W2Q5_9FIRM|nr:TetR/AcrR family transcriptional regulator [Syntrophomonas zehnderi]CFX14358.1 Tetracycline transcriptional regulator, TetR-related, C-terminal [Syntrophomonas zehnderi OL-4]